MDYRGLRNACRRLVIELAVVVALVSLPITVPRGTSTGRAWSFIAEHPSTLLHVVVATLILAESSTLLVRAIRTTRHSSQALAAAGLAFTLLAYGSGLTYTATGQHESALTSMSLGWLGGILVYGAGWLMSRRALAARQRPATAGAHRPQPRQGDKD